MRHWLLAVIVAVTVLRLVVASVTPLAPDEAYYWVWSRALAPAYLDHPPMVAIWIAVGTALLGKTALGVRVLGPVSAALASWMLLDTGRRLFPAGNAGATAVMLLNASLLLGVGSVIMTPDTPLLFFWTATLWAAARIATGGSAAWWLLAGLFAGLALDSKYTGLFLWIGIGPWIVLVPTLRPWLRRWQPYAAIAIGLLLFAPVVAWNAQHHWAGFLKQGGRVGDWQPIRAMGFEAELIAGQIGLATPLVWWLSMVGLLRAIRNAWSRRDPAWTLLAVLSLPPVIVFLQHALGDRVQGNWPAIIYPALAVAAGASIRTNRPWLAASSLGLAITLLAYGHAALGLLPLPPRLDPIALRLAGWAPLAHEIEAEAAANGAAFVTADGYAPLSELAWSLKGPVVAGTDDRWHLTNLPVAPIQGQVGLLLQDPRRTDPPDPAMWASARLLRIVSRPGSGTPGFALYSVIAAPGQQAAILPR